MGTSFFQPTQMPPPPPPGPGAAFGSMLRHFRKARQWSQLQMALAADASSRHVSFLESGRAQPSREMVLRLAEVLRVTLRDQNQLLQSAGFAAVFPETPLGKDPLGPHRLALESILSKQEPYPGLVADSNWNIRMRNEPLARMARAFIPPENFAAAGAAAGNAVKYLFDPLLWRPHIVNWELTALQMMQRLRDEGARELMAELLRYPGVPSGLATVSSGDATLRDPVMTIRLVKGSLRIHYFSILSTFGLPQDITLQELRIKLFFPADPETEAVFRQWAEAPAGTSR
ncbi:MAG: helix-turn-helix transcriptional regulator [Acidobacteria bacterium]|nr:helix-turn-helix transcriptional regulator [Acidobacteriota bacterium]